MSNDHENERLDRGGLATEQVFYVHDAQGGGFFMETHNPGSGEYDYTPADPRLTFREVKTGANAGKFVAVRSEAVAAQQGHAMSQLARFGKAFDGDSAKTVNPREAKQHMKSLNGLERQLNQLVLDRAVPGPSNNVEVISDSEAEKLKAEYFAWVQAGSKRDDKPDFEPMVVYARKLITSSGKVIRPILAGEVGARAGKILVLGQGYGTGNLIAVSETVGNGPRTGDETQTPAEVPPDPSEGVQEAVADTIHAPAEVEVLADPFPPPAEVDRPLNAADIELAVEVLEKANQGPLLADRTPTVPHGEDDDVAGGW